MIIEFDIVHNKMFSFCLALPVELPKSLVH